MRRWVAMVVVVAASARVEALPPAQANDLLARARQFLGTRYEFGGRALLKRDGTRQGIDCQGLVFRASEALMPACSWRSLFVGNVRSVAAEELGAPVPGLAPVSSEALDVALLERGDVLMLLGPERNPAEAAMAVLEGVPQWVWHVGLYSGDGLWVVGDHHAGQVVETELKAYLREHSDEYRGVFVTRMVKGPRPNRCKAPRKVDSLVWQVDAGNPAVVRVGDVCTIRERNSIVAGRCVIRCEGGEEGGRDTRDAGTCQLVIDDHPAPLGDFGLPFPNMPAVP